MAAAPLTAVGPFAHKVPRPGNWDAMSTTDSLAPPAPASTITTTVVGAGGREGARRRRKRQPDHRSPIREVSCERGSPSPRRRDIEGPVGTQTRGINVTPLMIWTVGLVMLACIAVAVFAMLRIQNERRRIQSMRKAEAARDAPHPRNHPSIVDTINKLTSPPAERDAARVTDTTTKVTEPEPSPAVPKSGAAGSAEEKKGGVKPPPGATTLPGIPEGDEGILAAMEGVVEAAEQLKREDELRAVLSPVKEEEAEGGGDGGSTDESKGDSPGE